MERRKCLRFSFGMIVFNGAAFLQEVLESIYDFAFEIIVVEGPDRNALPMAGPDGGSADGTMEILSRFPDPKKKIKIIRGVWKSKDQQCNRFIEEATGDYIWQVDDDEIYKKEDLLTVERILLDDPEITAVAFQWQNFFKGFERVMVADPPYEVWRLFRLRPGYRFSTHRPPTVVDPFSGAVMNHLKPFHGHVLAESGVFIYHYSYVFDDQVRDKIRYHTNFRLDEQAAGTPLLPGILSRQPWIARGWKGLWAMPWMRFVRRYLDQGFHYDYFEKIWEQWDLDPEGVESRFGISPSPCPYRRTAAFKGVHPEVISRRLTEKTQ
jgi:glycosyltransferase involved in cell wall biosynthesis